MADAPAAMAAGGTAADPTTDPTTVTADPTRQEGAAALMAAAAAGDLTTVTALLASGAADPAHQDPTTGRSPLMAAAATGATPVVAALLESGAPWNAVDRDGACAGEHANAGGHADTAEFLLEAGVRAELVLGALEAALRRRARPERGGGGGGCAGPGPSADGPPTPPTPAGYLQQAVSYTTGADGAALLADEAGRGVMMEWEAPLMAAHAHAVCAGRSSDGDDPDAAHVLNIGFGLGLVDGEIAARRPTSHTICEPHPGVLARMREQGWMDRPGVRVVPLTWQAALAAGELKSPRPDGRFTGIFFDPFEEGDDNVCDFHATALPSLLARGGTYSFFNGLNADNPFFHAVSCEVVSRRLASAGFDASFVRLPLPGAATAGETWRGVTNAYWQLETYSLPVIGWAEDGGDDGGGGGGRAGGTTAAEE